MSVSDAEVERDAGSAESVIDELSDSVAESDKDIERVSLSKEKLSLVESD